jgi:hypothetical protein
MRPVGGYLTIKYEMTRSITAILLSTLCLLSCLLTSSPVYADQEKQATGNSKPQSLKSAGFSFDCDNTPERPCRRLIAWHQGKPIDIEPSGVVWADDYGKAIVVSDNLNDLVEQDAAQYVCASFGLAGDATEIAVTPLLSREQAQAFLLYDLEAVTLKGDRLYVMGSLGLHAKNPTRDRWERHQFVQFDLQQSNDQLRVDNLTHVTRRWPDFRDWLISKSGYEWMTKEILGKAEGEGINVEALAATASGNLIIGFRGPLSAEGGALALEITPPDSADDEPELVKWHVLPPLAMIGIPKGAANAIRGMAEIPGEPGTFYVLLGPTGDEMVAETSAQVLARWDVNTNEWVSATRLPANFVAEGVAPIDQGRILLVDDAQGMILIATEE